MANELATTGSRSSGLVREYKKGPRAVDGIDISVAPGEIYGFLGPNGAGQVDDRPRPDDAPARRPRGRRSSAATTSSRTGRRSAGSSASRCRRPRSTRSSPRATTCACRRRCRASRKRSAAARAEELLHRVGLVDAADRKVAGYSGGMKRRLDLALALVHSPRILFLDEPTTGLDPQSRTDIWNEVALMRARGGRDASS